MPLQNRVSPFGELCAFCARGLFMGNRGGRFHTGAKTLTSRRWASRQWICCVLDFKGRPARHLGPFLHLESAGQVEGNLRISSCKTAYPCTQRATWSADTEREPMQVADDAKWPLPERMRLNPTGPIEAQLGRGQR